MYEILDNFEEEKVEGLWFELLNLTKRVLSLMLSMEDSETFNLKICSVSFGNFSD